MKIDKKYTDILITKKIISETYDDLKKELKLKKLPNSYNWIIKNIEVDYQRWAFNENKLNFIKEIKNYAPDFFEIKNGELEFKTNINLHPVLDLLNEKYMVTSVTQDFWKKYRKCGISISNNENEISVYWKEDKNEDNYFSWINKNINISLSEN